MSDTITGSTIADRYRVTGLLRGGRMGDVYVARRLDNTRRVCIKLLDPSLFNNEEAIARFERESRVARTIDHPCTMRVLDYGRSSHGPYLVTEFVEGDILADLVEERERLDPQLAAHIIGRVALALQAAHDQGVVHRDLSPTNVLVTHQANEVIVKVTDFGLSLMTADTTNDGTLTAVGVRIGTPTYMAPEYIEDFELDHRADIYGMGVMLYEMLVGQPPYTGRPYKVMDAHVNDPVPSVGAALPEVPQWLDSLVSHLMAKNPSDRPQTAQEVADAVERGMQQRMSVAEYQSASAAPAPARERQPAADPGEDPILVRFMDRHLLHLSTTASGPPDPARCYVVGRVASPSIASRAGAKPGWLVHLPEGPQDTLLDPRFYREVCDHRTYHLYAPGGQERVELKTTGLHTGMELLRSAENIKGHYDPLKPNPGALLDLWRHEAFEQLEKLSWRTMTQQRGAAGILNTGLFAKFLGADKPKLFDHPALLFHGAALFERGDHAAGIKAIIDFKAKYASHWPSIYDAVAHYYAAKDKLRTGSKGLAADLFRQAYHLAPLEVFAKAYATAAGEPLQVGAWVGRTFTDYSMDEISGHGSAKLSDICRQMDGSQVLAVCMMGGFRANADYDAFVQRYMHHAAFFHDFLYGLHVVTTATRRDADHPEHYVGEDLAQHAGVNMMILHDYRAFVQRAIKPENVPMIYLINKFGTCVHHGQLTGRDLWEALALSGKERVGRMARDDH